MLIEWLEGLWRLSDFKLSITIPKAHPHQSGFALAGALSWRRWSPACKVRGSWSNPGKAWWSDTLPWDIWSKSFESLNLKHCVAFKLKLLALMSYPMVGQVEWLRYIDARGGWNTGGIQTQRGQFVGPTSVQSGSSIRASCEKTLRHHLLSQLPPI